MKHNETKNRIINISFIVFAFLSVIIAREKINSSWNLVTDWDLFNGIVNLLGLIILGFGYNAVNEEIKSRVEERASRNYSTLLSVSANFLGNDFVGQLNSIKDLWRLNWEKIAEDKYIRSINYCLSRINLIQKLIDQKILDFEDLMLGSGNELIILESAMYNLEVYFNKRDKNIKEEFNFPKAYILLFNIKNFAGERKEIEPRTPYT